MGFFSHVSLVKAEEYITNQNMHVAQLKMFNRVRILQKPEESLGRNRADEPLEQFARSLPAVVNIRKVSQ